MIGSQRRMQLAFHQADGYGPQQLPARRSIAASGTLDERLFGGWVFVGRITAHAASPPGAVHPHRSGYILVTFLRRFIRSPLIYRNRRGDKAPASARLYRQPAENVTCRRKQGIRPVGQFSA